MKTRDKFIGTLIYVASGLISWTGISLLFSLDWKIGVLPCVLVSIMSFSIASASQNKHD